MAVSTDNVRKQLTKVLSDPKRQENVRRVRAFLNKKRAMINENKLPKDIKFLLEILLDNDLQLDESSLKEIVELHKKDSKIEFWVASDGSVQASRSWSWKTKS